MSVCQELKLQEFAWYACISPAAESTGGGVNFFGRKCRSAFCIYGTSDRLRTMSWATERVQSVHAP